MALARAFCQKEITYYLLNLLQFYWCHLTNLFVICRNSFHYGIANSKSLAIIIQFYVFFIHWHNLHWHQQKFISKLILSGFCDSTTSTSPFTKFQVIWKSRTHRFVNTEHLYWTCSTSQWLSFLYHPGRWMGKYNRFTFVENTISNSPKAPTVTFLGTDRLFCFISICKFGSFKNPFETITSLSAHYFRFRIFIKNGKLPAGFN